MFSGGRQANPGHWPWQVAVLNKYREVVCGGTLVAPGWILTAAHCIRKHLYVRLGEHDLELKEGRESEYAVKVIKVHPNYNETNVDNDAALLRIPYAAGPQDMDVLDDHISTSSIEGNLQRHGRKSNRFSNSNNSQNEETNDFPPACIPEQDEDLPVGSYCTVIGWGKKKSSNIWGTDVLHEAKVHTYCPFTLLKDAMLCVR